MGFVLRDYQENGVQACLDILTSKKVCREIVVAPTGGGKSIYLAETAKRLNEPLLIVQPSKELLKQNYEKFLKVGGKATLCCASLKTKTIKGVDYTEIDGKLIKCREVSKITFCTVGTVIKYTEQLKKLGVKKIALDEAQLMTQSNTQNVNNRTVEKPAQIKKLVKQLGITNLVGLTATPLYLQSSMGGSSLKIMTRTKWKLFTDIRFVTQISELVKNNYWSKLYYQVNETDTSKLKANSSGSDYTVESLKDYYTSNNLQGQVLEEVENLKKEGRKSIIVFVPTIEEAEKLYKNCPNSAVVHSKLDDKTRDYFIDAFKRGEIPVIFNVNILAVGFDDPTLDAIITCRPTASLSVYYQQLGRGVRIHPEKENCKVVDFSGNVAKFGKVEELYYENVPLYGWGLFSGKDELLTDYPLTNPHRPTKKSLVENGKRKLENKKAEKQAVLDKDNPEITFGMFKGRKVWDIVNSQDSKRFFSWAQWFLKEQNKPSPYPKNHALINALNKYLKKDADEFNLTNNNRRKTLF